MTLSELIVGQTGTDEEVLAWCNTPSITKTVERLVSVRTLMGELGLASTEAIMIKLEAVPSLSRVVALMSPSEGGIDVGNAETRTQLDALVGVLTQDEVTAIKALGEELVSPAQNAGLGIVKLGQVMEAR